ncbi:MAG: DUF438 domain-containing protein [Deltaproteobacteria bacterium]|nr:DUF438 domain-containing protein [Deltaproteobacteria bacterium]
MEIAAGTKIGDLLREYPFLEEYLVAKSPRYRGLRNPLMRATMGKVATLERVAQVGGFELGGFLSDLEQEVRRTGEQGRGVQGEERVQRLKELLVRLHQGADPDEIKETVRPLVEGLDPTEIVRIGQGLVDAGVPEVEVKKLSDIHSELFRKALEATPPPEIPPGHAAEPYLLENRAAEALLDQLEGLLGRTAESPQYPGFESLHDATLALVRSLSEIKVHYQRKEHQLFPLLEAHGLPGPPQVMWAAHDEIRRQLREAVATLETGAAAEAVPAVRSLVGLIREMIYKEERILLPMCLDTFSEEDWSRVAQGEAEIGYAWIGRVTPEVAHARPPAAEGSIRFATGSLAPELIGLILDRLPLELTFVDEKDEVAYYSHGSDRVFPRSPGILGRAVQRCHPPQSLAKVERILRDFRAGRRDEAEFWIRFQEKLIHIRYFPVRGSDGTYRGTLEVVQDVTAIQTLQGERRLLDEE